MTKQKIEEIVADKVALNQACEDANVATNIARTEAVDTAPLTADRIEASVESLVVNAADAFVEIEQRALASNGKAYPLDYDFEGKGLVDRTTGEPVTDTGSIVHVNKYEYLSRGLARGVCYTLRNMLNSQLDNIAKQKDQIQKSLRYARNTGTDASSIDRMAGFLDTLVEQASMVEIAMNAAIEGYEQRFGDAPFVDPAQAQKAVAARMSSLSPETQAKLAKLGVTTNA